ncbi:MAG TPA: trigger factor [Vulgatibacter sp.]|nr:trigger factor [Vulgatibacter sp.]
MKVEVETVSPVEKKLSIEVEADRVATEFERAYRTLARQVRIPGFRQGKAPRRILESRYKDQVEQDVARHLMETSYREAVDAQDLFPVGSPVVSPDKLEAGKSFRFEARVEVKPEVSLSKVKGLELERSKAEVTDAMIDDELERLRQQLAQFAPIEDRQTASTGDYAVVDYVGTQGEEEIPGAKGDDVTLKVDEGSLLEGNAPQLAGVPVGETIEVPVEFPPDYQVESLRGVTGRFFLTLKSLKRREVPDLDDELAKDLGGKSTTLAELREEIRQNLQELADRRAAQENREKLLQALVAANPVEVPRSMIERAIDSMIMGGLERFERQGVDVSKLGLDIPKLREDLRGEATSRVKAALLLEAVAKQESIEVGDDEIAAEYARLAAETQMPEAKVRAHFEKSASEKEGLRQRLLEDKTVAMLEREAHVKG